MRHPHRRVREPGRRDRPRVRFLRNTKVYWDGRHVGMCDFWFDDQLLGHYAAAELDCTDLRKLREALRMFPNHTGLPFWLRNGDVHFFGHVWKGVQTAARDIVQRPGYTPPSTLADWERVAKTLIVTTSQLYRVLYGGGAPLIGNKPRVLSLPWPSSTS